MSLYFSPSTGGFYDTEFAKYRLPADAEKITREEYFKLKIITLSNKEIIVNEVGEFIGKERVMTLDELMGFELSWVDNEFDRIRDELEKVQDFDPRATGSVLDWRNYRKQLRAWSEDANFPSKEFRPKAPDFKE